METKFCVPHKIGLDLLISGSKKVQALALFCNWDNGFGGGTRFCREMDFVLLIEEVLALVL